MQWTQFAAPLDRFDGKGGLVGGTTGVNAQAGVFVAGVESEWLWSSVKGGASQTQDLFGVTSSTSLASRINWLSLNSVRAGFVAADRWLVYAKGGVALAKQTHSITTSQSLPGTGSVGSSLSGSSLHTGMLAGVGVEYAFLGNWSAKLEYNYVGFARQRLALNGTTTFDLPPTLIGTVASGESFIVRQNLHLVKFGINYHFNWGPEVVTARF